MKIMRIVCAALLMAILATTAQGSLIDNGDGTLTDDVAGLMWLADANYAMTSGYDGDGLMTWAAANAWADGLSYAGHDDWRLPTTDPAVLGYNQTGSEMGNLFYNILGGVADSSITTTHNANYNLLSNVQPSYYWSGTEYAPNPSNAWFFHFGVGYQYNRYRNAYRFYALAVRPADTAVPVPSALWLMGSGLAGLFGLCRRSR